MVELSLAYVAFWLMLLEDFFFWIEISHGPAIDSDIDIWITEYSHDFFC